MEFTTKHAESIINMLQEAQDVGMTHAVIEWHPSEMEIRPNDIELYDDHEEALDNFEMRAGLGLPFDTDHPVYCMSIDRMISVFEEANNLKEQVMNRNNWENIQDEMKQLRFSPQTIEETRQKMEKGVSDFIAHDQIKGNKGLVDVSAHFKKSGQSENYYLGKFEVALNTGKALEEGQKYFVISPNEQQPGKNISRSFENVSEGINYFKSQTGDSKLAAGKDAAHARDLATMNAGKIDYVEKGFANTFRTPALTQTFFVDRGRGFTVEQAANLIQGRSVFRDDLLNFGGNPYAAWVKLDFDTPKDKYQNYTTKQYHVPSYGFTIKEALEKYNIKELSDPEKAEKLIKSVENGNRPLVTTVKDGQNVKLYMETSPRYRQLNFFQENGRIEKREQFLKEPQQDQKLSFSKGQGKEQEQGMAV
ncbi:hypothetical protein SNE26_10255 [Mucilaginibacter sp. cycad4]|uniref:hypothetical protein n=1 Tax=Mucilaginibacter sp. cycad4 TaxID=3342096 RepID=UPI002AAA8336|nr:hypothetical protein [Mucilaginibacter gossypii]WPV02157.1 hypothetical protein SNE26_10255 [Mucilaginibacter gossypii]